MRWLVLLLGMFGTDADAQSPPAPSQEQAREFVRSLLVASPYRIPLEARNGEIRYQLTLADGTRWPWPETGEQHVEPDAAGTTTTLSICLECGREAAPTAAELQRYLGANAWVQSDDPAIARFARQHTRGRDSHRQMLRLRDAVQKHMTGPIDFRHYDSAVAALQSRSGDCTEFAVLLAALARARGIPARVAYGVAYSSRFTGQSHVFSPHTWVQAWDGQRWRSYDAGLGQFGSGHIALFVGDGSSVGLQQVSRAIRQIRIVAAAGIKPLSERAVNPAR